MTTKYKYKANIGMLFCMEAIEKVEVVSEAQNIITYIDTLYDTPSKKRVAKNTQYAAFFDTYDEAKSFLIDHLKGKITVAQSTLDRENATLKKVMKDLIQKEPV